MLRPTSRWKAIDLVNWRNEYGLIAVLQQIPNSVYMRLVSLQSCYMDLRHGHLTGNMLTYSKVFRHNCIRRILNIEWRSYTPDIVVLERKSRIEQRPILNQICWVGHVVRMGDGRLSKQLFYGELTRGKRPQHKPRKRFNPIRPEEGGSDNLR